MTTDQSLILFNKALADTTKKYGDNTTALLCVDLCKTALKNIGEWYRGEISGKRCAMNVTDATFTVAGSVTGGISGGVIGGAIFGPVGTLVGTTVGGIIGAELAGRISNFLTNKLFGLPKDVAVEEAYRTLGVRCNASNDQINHGLRVQRLQHHPDKGGDKAMFIKVESAMAIIKLHRGEFN